MYKRLFLLNGLAIIAVVLNHAAGQGFTAMFWWTDRYLPVPVPCFDQMGSLAYYVLIVIKRLTLFSVPAFLFFSGFFIAYSAKGAQTGLSWKMILSRIIALVIPCIIWFLLALGADYLTLTHYSFSQHLERVIASSMFGAYFYVSILCQMLLLSPLLTLLAKNRPHLLLIAAACIQIGAIILKYSQSLGEKSLLEGHLTLLISSWAFPLWIFYFAFGVILGFHTSGIMTSLRKFPIGILLIGTILALLNIIEPLGFSRLTGQEWYDKTFLISANLYAVAFILCFLIFDKVSIPLSKHVYALSTKTYGIYLINLISIPLAARFVYHVGPQILAHQVLYQPILIAAGLGVPLILMAVISRSPLRRTYRYLFG